MKSSEIKLFSCKKNTHCYREKTVKIKKWYFPSRIVLTKCVENFSKCNLKFFLDILIGKMEVSDHSEVSGFALDLKKNLVLHFSNLDIQEKYQITLGKIFHTLRQNNALRKVPFSFRCLMEKNIIMRNNY